LLLLLLLLMPHVLLLLVLLLSRLLLLLHQHLVVLPAASRCCCCLLTATAVLLLHPAGINSQRLDLHMLLLLLLRVSLRAHAWWLWCCIPAAAGAVATCTDWLSVACWRWQLKILQQVAILIDIVCRMHLTRQQYGNMRARGTQDAQPTDCAWLHICNVQQ
jgi:hypothetical protein